MPNTNVDLELAREMVENGLMDQAEFDAMAASANAEAITVQADEIVIEDHEALGEAIVSVELREAAYAEQIAGTDLVIQPDAVAPEAVVALEAAVNTVASAAPKVAKIPRKARINVGGSLGSYAASIAGPKIEIMAGTPVDTVALIDGIAAKKIRDKATNFLAHIHSGKRLSVFTKIGVTVLRDEGKLTMKRLIDLFQSADGKVYTLGTARSQAQQVVTLLPLMGIATKANGELIPAPANPYYQALMSNAAV